MAGFDPETVTQNDSPEVLYLGPLLVIEKDYDDPVLRPTAELEQAKAELTTYTLLNALRESDTSRRIVDGVLARLKLYIQVIRLTR